MHAMKYRKNGPGHWPFKLIAAAVVLGCLAIGLLGLLLPIIPGLLFLAIALVIAAGHFPSIDATLRRNRTLGRYLDRLRLIWRTRTLR